MLMIKSMATIARFRSTAVVVLVTLVASMTAPAFAQDNPQRQRDPTLPEIAPREIEIRGQFQVGFPSLQRQPLRGFASPPTVPVIPPDRLPYTETYKQERSDLPEQLPSPPSVGSRLATSPPPANGYVEAGAGRYLSRFAEGHVTLPVTPMESFEIDAAYDGSAGFEPSTTSDGSTQHDDVEGSLRFVSEREAVSIDAGLRGLTSTYDQYAAVPNSSGTIGASSPDRTVQSGGLFARIRTHGRIPTSFGLSFDQTSASANTEVGTDNRDYEQQRFAINARGAIPFGTREIEADIAASTSGLGSSAFEGDVQTLNLGGSAIAYRSGPTVIRAGARLLTFQSGSSSDSPPTPEASATYFVPTGELTIAMTPRFTIFAVNQPGLEHNTLLSRMSDTPWLAPQRYVRPTLYATRADAGVRVSVGPLRITSHAGYRYAPSYRFVEPGPVVGYENGFFRSNYESARIAEAGASLALQGFDQVQAILRATIRDGQLTDSDTSIPYFSPLVVESALTYSFLDGKALAGMELGVESPRYVDRSETEQTDTIVDLDLNGSYHVTPIIDIVARLDNMGASFERYAGYERPPTTVTAGIRIHW
ncbi:hypothetical protein CRI94_02500 [Longibacter salinarum]|uniref:TonB-dependent receptor-like beta-barrel domain-containing protein n=1 Tax=Longibacter salinarum TaxID=1850348 RepID=A0A2A8D301_9BACT|nr:TonB-dependent receptor [Longibacter salinarum]PEN15173.1 hypothetical protein CRI94_02500 [Longibacter salinarum]